MALSQNGGRRRYYHERQKVEVQAGNPVSHDVSPDARKRLVRELRSMSHYNFGTFDRWAYDEAKYEAKKVLGYDFDKKDVADLRLDEFLTFVEIAANTIWERRRDVSDLNALQSILADDLSAYRLRKASGYLQIQAFDNKHLHSVITDRTFELTQIAGLASAQGDYADAWRHYSRGDFDDAASNAGKAVESACKAVIKKVDPTSAPENMTLRPLVDLLVQKEVIPSAMPPIATHLEQIFRASGGLRNRAGDGAHGSVDLTTPEASVALLALRLSGTLIAFLAERWLQIK